MEWIIKNIYLIISMASFLAALLVLAFGSGWLPRYRARPRLAVRILHQPSRDFPLLTLEMENMGIRPTSLSRTVLLDCLEFKPDLQKFVDKTLIFYLEDDTDRALPPHQPKRFSLSSINPLDIPEVFWFRKYTIIPTDGRRARLLLRNALGGELSLPRYWLERALFRFWHDYYHRSYLSRHRRTLDPLD